MPVEIAPETTVSRAEGVLAENVLGETVILDVAADRYVRLNRSGAVLWERLAEPATVAELAGVLVARYRLAEDRALADATALVRQLRERGLVTL